MPKASAKALPAEEEKMIVTITKKQEVYLNKTKFAVNDLRPKLQAIYADRTRKEIFLKAEPGRLLRIRRPGHGRDQEGRHRETGHGHRASRGAPHDERDPLHRVHPSAVDDPAGMAHRPVSRGPRRAPRGHGRPSASLHGQSILRSARLHGSAWSRRRRPPRCPGTSGEVSPAPLPAIRKPAEPANEQ